ncbi:MAG: response regulator [Verrucomicrobiaceae bacterium]|nr:MAG: response regulator [Verrucomicrobiaceae bacterium]
MLRGMSSVGGEIVVVDDDTSMCLAIERLLSAAGWRVRRYGSAEELLAADGHESAGALVLDINLPGISGLELHRKLRARGNARPVFFITGQEREDTREQVRAAGAAGFFTKPFDGVELIRAIRGCLPAV